MCVSTATIIASCHILEVGVDTIVVVVLSYVVAAAAAVVVIVVVVVVDDDASERMGEGISTSSPTRT